MMMNRLLNQNTLASLLLLLFSMPILGQSIDDAFAQNKMRKDLEVFKKIRLEANSGLYKYRTKQQIDSIYHWADQQIDKSSTYRDFYNIICALTDYEGSLHNNTDLPQKYSHSLKKEGQGYFPYPILWVDNKWILNYTTATMPLGSEIIAINDTPIEAIIKNLYKYYTTDADNLTGKRIGIRTSFSKYYRLHYGLQDSFKVVFINSTTNEKEVVFLDPVGYRDYDVNFSKRHSKPYDQIYYTELTQEQQYTYEKIGPTLGLLTINTFSMGNEDSEQHKSYVEFLERVFYQIKEDNLIDLIVDVRNNGGGTDPNDVVTYSYLTSRNFQESRKVWISFNKIPLLRYYNSSIPAFLRPLGIGKYNRYFQKRFPNYIDGQYHIAVQEEEQRVRVPNKNAFTGNIYLLISPAVASAGSLFAAMVAGNTNAVVIGEEAMGGYYGHNGHTSMEYVLPKSGLITGFSIDNIEQDVVAKANQRYNRGIIADHKVGQSMQDFKDNVDTQLNYVLALIEKSKASK